MDWRHWSVQMNSTNEHTADETKSLSGTRAGNMKLMRFVCKAHVLWLSIHLDWNDNMQKTFLLHTFWQKLEFSDRKA